MQVNNVSSISFRANIPSNMKEELMIASLARGRDAFNACLSKMENVKDWGLPTSSLSVTKRQNPFHEKKSILSLVNSCFAPLREVEFKQKDTLLDTFMSLTKRDITDAENKLKI